LKNKIFIKLKHAEKFQKEIFQVIKNMNLSGKLSEKEVEAMLPDYIFNRLTVEERTEFEIAILNYPDLEKELNAGIELFARVEQLDYDKILKDKSQYLPERVVERLERNNSLYRSRKPNIRRLVLMFAFAASIIVFIGIANDFSFTKFIDDKILNKNKNVITVETTSGNFFTDLEKVLILENLDAEDLDYLLEDLDSDYLILLDKIENMDEKTFQEFLNIVRN